MTRRFAIIFSIILIVAPSLSAQINFTRHTISNNLRGAYWVYARDIDNDGDMDLASAAFDGADWWENNGKGSFSKHRVGPAKAAWSVFAEDLTGNGKIDIISGSTADKEIVWFKNKGGGNFQRRVVESNFQDPESIVAADFDGDGDFDLLSCAVTDGVVAWWENKGGNFLKHHIDNLPRAHSIYASDLDGDGKIDVIAGGSSRIRWYRNNGKGNFSRKNLGSKGAWCVFAADLDGDGDNDVLRTQRNNGDVDWFENNGSGGFSERNIATGFGESWSVVAGDLDGDGDADVAAAGFEGNVIQVWFNQGGAKFDKGSVVEQVDTPRAVWIADLDGDGDGDLAAAIRGDRDLVWYEAKGKPVASASLTVVSPNGDEILTEAASSEILWTATGAIAKVSIELSTDSGNSWSTITSSTRNDGKYNWLVPATSSQECLVRIADPSDGAPFDVSNGLFTIAEDQDPGGSSGLTFMPSDDAGVSNKKQGRNYGASNTLRIDGGDLFSYLKFNISGVAGVVTKATLRLYVENAGDRGGSIFAVSNDLLNSGSAWDEENLTFTNAPGITGSAISSVGLAKVDRFVEFDVTSAIAGNGVFSFGLSPDSPDKVEYSSKEGAVPPELFIESEAGSIPQKFSMNIATIGAGQVEREPKEGPYVDGTTVTLNALPSTGSAFDRWSGDANGVSQQISVIVDRDLDIIAKFKPIEDGSPPGLFPVADAYVKSSKPTTNYGHKNVLRVRAGSTAYHSYFKFAVSGITGGIEKAVVRLHVSDPSSDGGSLFTVSNSYKGSSTEWTEDDLNWNNAPEISGEALDVAGPAEFDQFVEFDVSKAITGNGFFSFGLLSNSSNSIKYYSKENSSPPQLVITPGTGSGGSSNRSPIAADDRATTNKGISIPINLAKNDGDPDGTLDLSTVAISDRPANGTLAVNKFSGVVTYTPAGNFSGEDSFTYTIRDNEGAESNRAAVSVTVVGGTISGRLTFQPTDDGQIKIGNATKNYGRKGSGKVEKDLFATYLKFDVSGVSGAIKSATLRLFVEGASKDAGRVYLVSNNFLGSGSAWDENGLNAGNAPGPPDNGGAALGSVTSGRYVETDVTSAVNGNGVFSLALFSQSNDQAKFGMKEGGNVPELVVEFGGSPSILSLTSKQVLTTQSNGPGPQLPENIALNPNFPNPFNGGTSIQYGLPEDAQVRLTIYNLLGQEIRTLVVGNQTAGLKLATWDGKNQAGLDVGSGLYFVRLEVAGIRLTRQIALQK